MKKILHFTLGPVQGFISDARRTRDFWSGSFLLSWLSGHAMAALEAKGGEIIFPQVTDDELFKAIQGKGGTTYIGSLPNRFKADVSNVTGDAAKICEGAIRQAWKKLADAVWDGFIKGEVAALGKGGAKATMDIWDRQVDGFWDINWVIGEPEFDEDGKPTDGKWLDERKNWRSHWQEDEPGDLCRLMGRYQELSGYHRINGKDEQKKFWDKLAEQKYLHAGTDKERRLRELNLKDNEYLCAIALIKRLFPLIAKDVIGWQPGGEYLSIINWPSVSYIAAVPWLQAIKEKKIDAAALPDAASTEKLKSYKGETETRLFGLPEGGIYDLDGHLLHEDGIRLWVKDNLKGKTDKERRDALAALLPALKGIQSEVSVAASEFYAILIMDGDRIGAKIGAHEKTVSTGLAAFTQSVKEYFNPIKKNPANGVLIYAGGDDVLAFVPVDTAIEAATTLREKYQEAFEAATKEHGGADESFTMSGAIIFAQYKIPLRAVLKKAHHYLDNIAKDKNGRDSLALAVMKPGGIAFDWVSGWGDPVEAMDAIAKDKSHYSNSFFYNVRARYAPLFEGDDPAEDRDADTVISNAPDFMRSILTAEYKKQFSEKQLKKMGEQAVNDAVEKLMRIGQPVIQSSSSKDNYHFDGALVARFLSSEGRWHLTKKQPEQKTEGKND